MEYKLTNEELEAVKLMRNAYQKAYYQKRKEDPEFKKMQYEYNKKYRLKNKERLNAYHSEWLKKNPEKKKLYEAHTAINWLKKQEALKGETNE